MTAKGKIGRLPFDVRQQLHRRKREGVPDVDLLAWLNSLPAVLAVLAERDFGGVQHRPEILAANLSEYFREGGPYAEWLKDEERVEKVERLSEFTARLAEATGEGTNRSAAKVAAGRLLELLEAAADDDVQKLAQAAASLCDAEAKALRAQTDRERLAVQQQAVSLDRDKFRYTVARDALRLFEDERARAIAEGAGNRDEKIAALLAYMETAEKEPAA